MDPHRIGSNFLATDPGAKKRLALEVWGKRALTHFGFIIVSDYGGKSFIKTQSGARMVPCLRAQPHSLPRGNSAVPVSTKEEV
jgi:hypothetical protein